MKYNSHLKARKTTLKETWKQQHTNKAPGKATTPWQRATGLNKKHIMIASGHFESFQHSQSFYRIIKQGVPQVRRAPISTTFPHVSQSISKLPPGVEPISYADIIRYPPKIYFHHTSWKILRDTLYTMDQWKLTFTTKLDLTGAICWTATTHDKVVDSILDICTHCWDSPHDVEHLVNCSHHPTNQPTFKGEIFGINPLKCRDSWALGSRMLFFFC